MASKPLNGCTNNSCCTLNSSSKRNSCRRGVECASFPEQNKESRRSISIAAATVLLFNCVSIPKHATADGIFDKYVKKKKLDPLEVYVPPVILTQSQIKDLGKTLEGDQPQYAAYRSILRSGPAASLRVNIRAVAQYASESGQGKAATDDVDQCLRKRRAVDLHTSVHQLQEAYDTPLPSLCSYYGARDFGFCLKALLALEDLDSLLLRASRNDQQASVELMKAKIFLALGALDSLLKKVPSAVLDKGKAIADAYMVREEVEPDKSDPEMQRLESLL